MADTDAFSTEQIVAMTLDGEAANQGKVGQQAVANVIMRRVALKWQGETTFRGVCLHPYQFSCWLPGADRDRIMAADFTSPAYQQYLGIASLAINGMLPNIVKSADSYQVIGTEAYWSKGLEPIAIWGSHEFYTTTAVLINTVSD